MKHAYVQWQKVHWVDKKETEQIQSTSGRGTGK